MNELNKLVETENAGSDLIILETYKTLVNLENDNMNELAKSDISYAEQAEFLDNISEKTGNINTDDDSANSTKEYILSACESIKERIEGSQ